jgi:hypothetical protein
MKKEDLVEKVILWDGRVVDFSNRGMTKGRTIATIILSLAAIAAPVIGFAWSEGYFSRPAGKPEYQTVTDLKYKDKPAGNPTQETTAYSPR